MRIHNMDRANFFGYSMGGYIGLMLAHRYPGKIRKLITYGTKLEWNSGIAAQEIKMLDPETIENKVPAFAKLLSERHQSAGWKNLLHHTATLMLELGTEGEKGSAFTGIEIPVLLMLGDRDKMVSLTETDRLYRQFKAGQLAVLPSHPHAIEKTDPSLLAEIIRRFLK